MLLLLLWAKLLLLPLLLLLWVKPADGMIVGVLTTLLPLVTMVLKSRADVGRVLKCCCWCAVVGTAKRTHGMLIATTTASSSPARATASVPNARCSLG
jgi:hypothetical protein